jgi:hypothetical protein
MVLTYPWFRVDISNILNKVFPTFTLNHFSDLSFINSSNSIFLVFQSVIGNGCQRLGYTPLRLIKVNLIFEENM